MNTLRAILEWVRESPVLAALVAVLIGLLVVFVVVGFSDPVRVWVSWVYCFFSVETGTEKFRILEFIGVGMGGVLLAIGATIANRRAMAMERTANEQAAANRGAEDGRRQERLKNAIEHLGHESDSVRLGGTYELFHLARDTEDLGQTATDILCAHIRQTTSDEGYQEKYKSKPSEEVQSLLTLLFRQEHEVFMDRRIDLQGSWLKGATLDRACLQRANLSGAYLQGADLSWAYLQEANLIGARLQWADLLWAQLQGVSFLWTQLQGAHLLWAQLQGANFDKAQLQGANLDEAQLQGANLGKAQLQGVSLLEAQLQGANLDGAQLQGAYLPGAQLQGANLDRAQLQGAYLDGTQLQGAHLAGAQLQGIASQHSDTSFGEHIRAGIDQEGDLWGVTFAGGLSREYLDFIVKDLPDKEAKELQATLEPHVGKPASNELPEGSGATTGSYTKEEAERWIAEYVEATGESPEAGG